MKYSKIKYSKKAYKERKMHGSLCAELRFDIPEEKIIGVSYQDLKDLVKKYNDLYELNIIFVYGCFLEINSYNIPAMRLFKEEFKKLSIYKLYVVSYVEGLDWYATFLWKKNEVLRGRLCSSINQKKFLTQPNEYFYKIPLNKKYNETVTLDKKMQESSFRENYIREKESIIKKMMEK